MKNKRFFWFFIIGLATFGLAYQLLTNPTALLVNLGSVLFVGLLFFGIYRLFLSKDKRAYRHPYRQGETKTQRTYFQQSKTVHKKGRSSLSVKREHPFKVIEGKKGKDNKPFS